MDIIDKQKLKELIKKDAENYGEALNYASWRFIDSYRSNIGEAESVNLWNTSKTIIRDAIIEYVERLKFEDEN